MRIRLVTFVCAIFALTYAAAFATRAFGPEGMVLDQHGRPQLTDHLSLWTAGKLAAEGRPAAAYDWDAHAARMSEALQRYANSPLQFSYPPSFLLVLAPLSSLPFVISFVLFGLLTLIPFAFTASRIIGRPDAALWMLAMVPTFWNFMVGQTGALAASLLAGGLFLLPSRPVLAGALFGLLTFKPHLGLLVPVALLAARRLDTIAAAALTGLVSAAASLAFWGVEPWLAFVEQLSSFSAFALADTNATAYKFQSLFGVARVLAIPAKLAVAAQIMLALALAALTWRVWRSPASYDLKCGALLASAALVSPYTYHYDLTLLVLAQAFYLRHVLAKAPRTDELPAHALLLILAVNALIMLFPPLSLPTGFAASVLLLATFLAHLSQERPDLLPRFRAGGSVASATT